MWLNPYPIIWRTSAANIPVPGDPAAALTRLRARVVRWAVLMPFSDAFAGSVGERRIRVWRYRRRQYGTADVVLDARLELVGSRAQLVGEYRTSHLVRVFNSIWFGMVLASIPLCWISALFEWPDSHLNAVLLTIGPPAMLLLGRAMLAWNDRTWADDSVMLKHFVIASLAEPRT